MLLVLYIWEELSIHIFDGLWGRALNVGWYLRMLSPPFVVDKQT